MIPFDIVQKIQDTANIVDVVKEYVSLKRAGTNYKGNCPFHNEKTPSFMVSPAKGIYKCFGCGASGNSVKFVMDHDKISYPEALKYLAKKFNIDFQEEVQTEEQANEYKERESLFVVTEFAKDYFIKCLHNTDEGKSIGLSYFKERNFREDIIKKFELGWSPEKRDALTETAIRAGYKLQYLEKTGLSIVKEETGYKFDRFAGRVIFPIKSLSGKTIAFGGRILRIDKNTAKYLNSPESELYHKSDILYGINLAKNEIVKTGKCYMVEGYTDVISMHQAGIENVVASSGTSLTENQVRLVKRFTSNLTILYDGDNAGIKASLRGIDIVLAQDVNVKIVLLPDGEDPDSFAKSHTSEELLKYIEDNEKDFIRFKTELLIKDAQNDPVKRAHLITEIVKSISVISDRILRAEYIKECSSLLNVREEVLYDEIRRILGQKLEDSKGKFTYNKQESTPTKHFPQIPAFVNGQFSEVNEKEVIYFLINFGDKELFHDPETNVIQSVAEYIISEMKNEEMEFRNLLYQQIFEDYENFFINNEIPNKDFFMHHINEQIRNLTTDVLSPGHELSKLWKKRGGSDERPENRLEESIPEAIVRFKFKIVEMMNAGIDEAIKDLKSDEMEKMIELFQKKSLLDSVKIQLRESAGERTLLLL